MNILKTIKVCFWKFVYALIMTAIMLLCTIWEILRFGHPIKILKEAARIVYDHYEKLCETLERD